MGHLHFVTSSLEKVPVGRSQIFPTDAQIPAVGPLINGCAFYCLFLRVDTGRRTRENNNVRLRWSKIFGAFGEVNGESVNKCEVCVISGRNSTAHVLHSCDEHRPITCHFLKSLLLFMITQG